jgi:hypothetical protein
MTDYDDQAEAQARREYIEATFGNDALEGLATDQPRGGTRSAEEHARDYWATTRAANDAQNLALVNVRAKERDEDEALESALHVMRRGRGVVTRGQLRKAARALERQGYSQGTTAEQIAHIAGQGPGWRPAS